MQALVGRIPVRARTPLAWLVPVLFAFWIHRDGLQCWFFQDDFAWLGLLRQVHSAGDLLRTLFDPAAQGTIRPWSERGFFLLFEYLFGFNSLPFRVAAFSVMAVNFGMIAWIMKRITGSHLAGALAGVVWTANAALMTVMTWNSAFNEALCPFFLLAALILFIRYAETGNRIYWWSQLAVFMLGFGALETNIVYPALACAWVLFIAPTEQRRALLRSLVFPFAISVAYFIVHRMIAPIPQSGAYAVHIDGQIFKTLALYAKWSLVPADFFKFGHTVRFSRLILITCGVAIAIAFFRDLKAHRTPVLFFAAWFIITLAPILPLPGHRTDYYLTIPLIGLGMFAGCASLRWPAPTLAATALYLAGMVPVTLAADRWALTRTATVRTMVEGIEQAREAHPSKLILLDGVTTDLYNDAFGHSPFWPLNIDNVYLTPGSERAINPVPGILDLHDAVLEPSIVLRALRRGGAVVYSFSGNHLRNVTEAYGRSAAKMLPDRLPDHLDAGNALFSDLLGPEWLPAESGFRWMPGRATLKLRGPGREGGSLIIDGYCPAEQLKQAPRRLWVIVDGVAVGETKIEHPESNFHRLFALPSSLWGRDAITVEMQVDPVTHQSDRVYGLVFGRIAVRP